VCGAHLGGAVVGVEDEGVGRGLAGEDLFLRGNVGLEAVVAVEVVGGDVEDDGDAGVELIGGFELEAGDLEDVDRLGGGFGDELDDGQADVAADLGGDTGFAEDLAEEGGGGGLAVGAGDGDDAALEEAAGELELAHDGEAVADDLGDFGGVERNAGRDDDEVLAAEGEQAVTAGFDHDAGVEQRGDLASESDGGTGVRDGDAGAEGAQEFGGGEAGFAETYDEDALVLQIG